MPAREVEERLLRACAMGEIAFEQALDRAPAHPPPSRRGRSRARGPPRAEAAADMDVIALDGVAIVRGRDLAGDQADVADIVLRAGMMAAGEMDVDRAVELDARLAPARDLLGMALGVGGGEAAADIAGAGDEAGADRARAGREPERLDAADRVLDPVGSARRRSAGSARR